ncbi:unnamed protein product [Anisakis simplex]|uniref:30S ribosomal protein S14 n=1 Tax=Anisakis simplex TaxID=6269 RepID=A0A0M3JQD9_ANISI|nr:unnamed protein product [Anisakis simplex]
MLSPQSASGSRNDMVAMKRPKRQLTNVYERSAVNKRAANIAMR